MLTLLIGKNSMLGVDILKRWKYQDSNLVALGHSELDIRSLPVCRKVIEYYKPDVIILAAAYTDVDGAEEHPYEAFDVNEIGTSNVATAAAENQRKLVYISTDYVFDGKATQPYSIDAQPNPINTYGWSKLRGEWAVQKQCPFKHLIVRTSWLFGAAKPCFPEKVLKAAKEHKKLMVVADQIGAPTYTEDLARVLHQLVMSGAAGMFHVTNNGNCSWFEFMEETLRESGLLDGVVVQPITTEAANRRAARPKYSVLSLERLRGRGIEMWPWKTALKRYLQELREAGRL